MDLRWDTSIEAVEFPIRADALVRAADEAMYVAKRNGGSCYVFAGDNR